jgi:polyhydroxybutyrate depolymerase
VHSASHRTALAVLAVAALVVSASACSSGSDDAGADADAGGGSSSTTTPAPADAAGLSSVELAPAVDPAGTVTHSSLTVDGTERTYRLYVPHDLPDGPVPLFIGLHGGLGWGDQFAATDHIEGLAESNGFVVVHPDGVRVAAAAGGRAQARSAVWNGGICCGIAARDDVDDVGFIRALIDRIEDDHAIDPHQVFAFGHSNGAIMSYRLACELSDRIVGVGVVAGTLGVANCHPAQPVSVLHLHGTADDNLPLAGGVGKDSLAGVDFPPPRQGFDTLADADGCGAATETTDGDVTTTLRQPCEMGTTMAFVTLAGAPHPWPGGTAARRPRRSASGPAAADDVGYDATSHVVAFLLAHPRP